MSDLHQLSTFFQTAGTGKSFSKGSSLFVQGQDVHDVAIILKGLVKITDNDKYGYGRTVAIFGKDHIIPISWLFIREPEQGAIYNYVALTRTEILCVSRQEVHNFLDATPILYKPLADATSKAYVNAASRIHNLQKTNVTEKVEFVLYYLATLLGGKKDNHVITINAPLTHQDIADIAGLSRESVTHLLSKQKYREIFWKSDGKTSINLALLDTASMPPVFGMQL